MPSSWFLRHILWVKTLIFAPARLISDLGLMNSTQTLFDKISLKGWNFFKHCSFWRYRIFTLSMHYLKSLTFVKQFVILLAKERILSVLSQYFSKISFFLMWELSHDFVWNSFCLFTKILSEITQNFKQIQVTVPQEKNQILVRNTTTKQSRCVPPCRKLQIT